MKNLTSTTAVEAAAPAISSDNVRRNGAPTREEVRDLVEENWRQFLNFASQGSQALGAQVIQRFEEKTQALAAKMPPEQGEAFLAMIEEERDKIFDEYTASPESLKKRLGVAEAVSAPIPRNRQGVGEMVVKTAVRASIWALIWDLFR